MRRLSTHYPTSDKTVHSSIHLRKCVCDDSELSHDGGKRDFWRLSGCDEGLIFSFHCGIESDGDEGGHIEGLPQVNPATADKAVCFAVRAGTLRR